ncbi:hypothetical protein [Dactylosporangium sp. NPDC000521]|uniref:hypothetical protein n=1 Tax=Dactylosporangium sp. NPDC000521 TaxID=3363975 RepID=UPI0036C73071
MTETKTETKPDAALRRLEKLLGTWEVSGDATGTVTYEWGPGEKFVLQHVDITLNDHHIVGLEVIGRLLPFGAEEPSEEIMSRFYGSDGETYDYVYEVSEDGSTLTIWGGVRDSPAYFKGTFDKTGTKNEGAWVYPGGGGYTSNMTKVK